MEICFSDRGKPGNRAGCLCETGPHGLPRVGQLHEPTDEAEHTLELVRQEGQDGEVLKFDVGNRVQVSAVLEAWMEKHPEEYIEVLVNNAGVRRDNLMVFMPGEDWDCVLGTGLGGFYNVTQPLLQPMLVHKFGRIVNMASVSGLKGMPGAGELFCCKGRNHCGYKRLWHRKWHGRM